MARRQKAPLRAVTKDERAALAALARASSERADRVARVQALLAVADGANFTAAAQVAGRRSGDAVSQLVARFNAVGLAALTPRRGGGATKQYGTPEQERILRAVRRAPDREQDGTATWSLSTLQRALRTASDGLPHGSTKIIVQTVWEAGTPGRRAGPGATPAWPSASARTARW